MEKLPQNISFIT